MSVPLEATPIQRSRQTASQLPEETPSRSPASLERPAPQPWGWLSHPVGTLAEGWRGAGRGRWPASQP